MKYRALTAIATMFAIANVSATQAQGVSSEGVKIAFAKAVTICAKSVSQGARVMALPEADRSALSVSDPNTGMLAGRTEAGALNYDVAPAAGIVTMTEKPDGSCDVVGYGPRVLPTYAYVKNQLTLVASNLIQTQSETTREDYLATYELPQADGSKVRVFLMGGEPGMGSRLFRFPMFTASVTRVSAN
jgi:hypothetical protein